ncbi:MAG TPA: hypothetical protein VGS62_01710 [Streptosporangiaceae bacterium]|nr:hypothetical protein [Streptosporangiaceae bacterium]
MRLRPSSGPRPGPGPPEFLVDRSLSQVLLPAELRRAGLTVHTLPGALGDQAARELPDADWIALAGERGWVVLTRDDRLRLRPAARQAITGGKVRVFCLATAGLSFAGQASYLVANRLRIIRAARQPGPYVYSVYRDRIRKLWPDVRSPM